MPTTLHDILEVAHGCRPAESKAGIGSGNSISAQVHRDAVDGQVARILSRHDRPIMQDDVILVKVRTGMEFSEQALVLYPKSLVVYRRRITNHATCQTR